MWGSPFMTEALTSLQNISNDKEEDEKIDGLQRKA